VGAPRLTWDGYATQWAAAHGGFDPRRASAVVQVWLRIGYGLGRVLASVRINPNTITVAGLLFNLAVPVTAARGGGWPLTGAVLVVIAAMADTVDGAVAIVSERTSTLGSLYDTLADRAAELCWLTAFWLMGTPMWLLVLCGAVAWLHEYVRARMATLGLSGTASVTVGEWMGRVCVTVVALILGGLIGVVNSGVAAGAVTIAAVVWLFLGVFGLSQLLAGIRKSVRRDASEG